MAFKIDYSPLVRVDRSAQIRAMSSLGSGIGGAIKGGIDKRAATAETVRLKGLSERARGGDEEALDAIAVSNPELAKDIEARTGAKTAAHQKAMAYDMAEAVNLHKSGNQEAAEEYMKRRIEAIEDGGRDSSHSRQILEMYMADPEKGAEYMGRAAMSFLNPKEFAKMLAPGGIDEAVSVGAQEILEDGTIIQSTAKGPVVYNPEGKKVTGRAAADAIKISRAEKVSNLRAAAGGKRTAALEAELELKGEVEADIVNKKNAANISVKAYEKIAPIYSNIKIMDEIIELIDSGVETGVVMEKLPSIRQNAKKLDNLQGRLGLNVIQNTTFGALSESELKFALAVALPQGLEGEELKAWVVKKRDAQAKLADYLESSAIYLGTPGNTVAGWTQKQKDKRQQHIISLPAGETYFWEGKKYIKGQ